MNKTVRLASLIGNAEMRRCFSVVTGMRKRYLLVLALFCGITRFATASDFSPALMVSFQPQANWIFDSGIFLDYEISPSPVTTVELGLRYKNLLNFLFGFDYKANDNYVGEIADSKVFQKIVGQIGIWNFSLRATYGDMNGIAAWNAPPVPGQPDKAVVGTQYFELELLYSWKFNGDHGLITVAQMLLAPYHMIFFYDEIGRDVHSGIDIGFTYINYNLPVQLSNSYQDDMVFDYYGIYCQVSGFKMQMDAFRSAQKSGVRFFVDYAWSLGYAQGGGLTEEGRRRNHISYVMNGDVISMLKNNGATNVDDLDDDPNNVGTTFFGYSGMISAGLCGGFIIGKGMLGIGVGYDFFAQGFDSNAIHGVLLRHGLSIKAYYSF